MKKAYITICIATCIITIFPMDYHDLGAEDQRREMQEDRTEYVGYEGTYGNELFKRLAFSLPRMHFDKSECPFCKKLFKNIHTHLQSCLIPQHLDWFVPAIIRYKTYEILTYWRRASLTPGKRGNYYCTYCGYFSTCENTIGSHILNWHIVSNTMPKREPFPSHQASYIPPTAPSSPTATTVTQKPSLVDIPFLVTVAGATIQAIQQHNLETGQLNFLCKFPCCSFYLINQSNNYNFICHLYDHVGMKTFTCSLCNKFDTFDLDEYRSHTLNMHGTHATTEVLENIKHTRLQICNTINGSLLCGISCPCCREAKFGSLDYLFLHWKECVWLSCRNISFERLDRGLVFEHYESKT